MPEHDLSELTSELLVQAAEALDTGTTPAPERQVLTVGAPSFDCPDQLAAFVVRVREADIGDSSQVGGMTACHKMTLVDLRLTLTVCVPGVGQDGKPPGIDALNLSAVRLYAQGWTMWCGLRNRLHGGEMFDEGQPKRAASVGPLVPVDPQGGVAGWSIDVSVELDPDGALGIEGS